MYYDIEWLKNEVTDREDLKFLYFWGHTNQSNETVGKSCLSQWYESPFVVDGVTYKTAEHWMMAKKALLFGDSEIFEKIVLTEKPDAVKDLGRRISGFNDEIWTAERYGIVKAGNLHKFKQHRQLSEYLLGTGDRILLEASPVDRIWGIGLAQDHADASNPSHWPGLNLLGFALMEVRDLLVNMPSSLEIMEGPVEDDLDKEELPKHVIEGIKRGQDQIKAGRYITFDAFKKKLSAKK